MHPLGRDMEVFAKSDVIEPRTICKALDVSFVDFVKDFEDRLKGKGIL